MLSHLGLRKIAIFSYILLIVVVLAKLLLFSDLKYYISILFVVPLLLPLLGVLKGKPYQFSWAAFIVLIYFLDGVGDLAASLQMTWLDGLEVFLSLSFFFSAAYYLHNFKNQAKKKDII